MQVTKAPVRPSGLDSLAKTMRRSFPFLTWTPWSTHTTSAGLKGVRSLRSDDLRVEFRLASKGASNVWTLRVSIIKNYPDGGGFQSVELTIRKSLNRDSLTKTITRELSTMPWIQGTK